MRLNFEEYDRMTPEERRKFDEWVRTIYPLPSVKLRGDDPAFLTETKPSLGVSPRQRS